MEARVARRLLVVCIAALLFLAALFGATWATGAAVSSWNVNWLVFALAFVGAAVGLLGMCAAQGMLALGCAPRVVLDALNLAGLLAEGGEYAVFLLPLLVLAAVAGALRRVFTPEGRQQALEGCSRFASESVLGAAAWLLTNLVLTPFSLFVAGTGLAVGLA